MPILEIIKYKNPILRRKAEAVSVITDELKQLIASMIETMKSRDGVGLAAPQVGISKRLIVMQTDSGFFGFINPKIIKTGSAKSIDEEGCLSIPDVRLNIVRADEIEVAALDIEGKVIKIQAADLIARIFQHEIDHLDGILITDRYNRLLDLWENVKKRLRRYKKLTSSIIHIKI